MPRTSKASNKNAHGKPRRSAFMKYFFAIVALLALGNVAGGYFAYQHWIVASEQQTLNRLSGDAAGRQAAVTADYLREVKAKLRNFTRREAASKALAEDNAAMLETLAAALESELESARAVRLFKTGEAQLDRDGEIPISFAELDMINRTEKRENVAPEATRAGGEWRINFAEPVPFDDEETDSAAVGVLFASIELTSLHSRLSNADPALGNTALLQQYGEQEPQTLLQVGEGSAGGSGQAAVPGSHLLVRFTPSTAMAEQAHISRAGFFAGTGAMALTSLALAYFLAQLLSGSARRAQQTANSGADAEFDSALEALEADSVLDLEVSREDSELVGLKASKEPDPLDIQDTAPPPSQTTPDLPAEIFRSYDIRGLVKTQLTPHNVVLIGQAIGSQVLAAGESTVVVGRDGRTHSPDVAEQLIEGILATGCNVVNIGMVPTPMMYFACSELDKCDSGVMVTASHNPPEYNGFKVVINGDTLKDAQIQHLRARALQKDFAKGAGREDFSDYSFPYIERIFSDVALAGEVSVVIDAGNGAAGEIAPRLFDELGCKVTPLFCSVDGNFPNHPPDPSVSDNLKALIAKVKEVGADLGIALDGDGDRVGIVTASGRIIPADRLLMLLAKDIVARNPGADVLFDVKCSRELNNVISSYGGRPIMWKSGHSHMKAKMKETGALLGGELSGHIFIKERWYGFDDGLYAAARIMEIMSLREQDLDSIFEAFPALPATPEIKVAIADDQKFSVVKRLIEESDFGQGRTTTIDGLRVDFPNGWGLVRASNTSAALTLRFEGENEAALTEIQSRFKKELLKIDPQLPLNF